MCPFTHANYLVLGGAVAASFIFGFSLAIYISSLFNNIFNDFFYFRRTYLPDLFCHLIYHFL